MYLIMAKRVDGVNHGVQLRCWLAVLIVAGSSMPMFAQSLSVQVVTDASPESPDWFGASVSVSGKTAAVGVPQDDCMVGGLGCGSVYIYGFNGVSWIEEQQLTASDARDGDVFGDVVSVSGDRVLVGAEGVDCPAGDSCGVAYVFRFNGTEWEEEQKLTASDSNVNDRFGRSVALGDDVAIVGAYRADCVDSPTEECGAAYVFRFNGIVWEEEQKLTPTIPTDEYRFGWSVAIEGDVAVVGAQDVQCDQSPIDFWCGAAHVFRFNGNEWGDEQRLTPSDQGDFVFFGSSVSLSSDALVVGAPGTDCADGNSCGSAYVFRFDGIDWIEEQRLVPFDQDEADWFGDVVSISNDRIVVGAPVERCESDIRCGSAYIFRADETGWHQQQKLVANEREPGDWFGRSVSVSADSIVVGAFGDVCAEGPDCGSAYLYLSSQRLPAVSLWGVVLMGILMLSTVTLVYRHRLHADTQ